MVLHNGNLSLLMTTLQSCSPHEIVPTDKRPDIIIWSVTTHHVIMFELTCGAEEGIPIVVRMKKERYGNLLAHIKDT